MSFEVDRLRTKTREISGISIVKVDGEIDAFTASTFRSAIHEAADRQTGHLVIDLSDVAYMDSNGFGALLGAAKAVKSSGGSVKLAGCNEAIRRIMRITGLDSSLEIFGSVDEAIAA